MGEIRGKGNLVNHPERTVRYNQIQHYGVWERAASALKKKENAARQQEEYKKTDAQKKKEREDVAARAWVSDRFNPRLKCSLCSPFKRVVFVCFFLIINAFT